MMGKVTKICYTAIFGNYDWLTEPFKTKGWKYICITDTNYEKNKWEIINVGKVKDSSRAARYWKIMGHDFFRKKYPNLTTVWVDGCIHIGKELEIWTGNNEGDLVVMKHPKHISLDEELNACVENHKDDIKIMKNQVRGYKQEGYDGKGMIQSTIMLRRGDLEKPMSCWWNEVKNKSRRDQLSFGYSMWKTGQEYKVIDFWKNMKQINKQETRFWINTHKK